MGTKWVNIYGTEHWLQYQAENTVAFIAMEILNLKFTTDVCY